MDNDVAAMMADLDAAMPGPERFDVADFRASAAGAPATPTIAMASVDDQRVAAGDHEIPVRVYRPAGDDMVRPLIVYLHGGGFILGDLDSHDPICRRLARDTDSVVCAVDYRLAPEHPFPEPVEDAYAATVWAADRARDLGGDPTMLSIAGDSSGAMLAAAVALMARDRDGPALRLQALIVPMLAHHVDTRSRRRYGNGGFCITTALLDWYSDQYVAPSSRQHPYCSPLDADVHGVAPAFIYVAELDPLRDDGQHYARRLRASGVDVVFRQADGLFHAFPFLPDALATVDTELRAAYAELSHVLRHGSGLSVAPTS